MLIDFKLSNYRSFLNEEVLSLVPEKKQTEKNILTEGSYSALNVIAVYGANASGKSNLIKGLKLLDQLVHVSSRKSSTSKLPFDPFLLKENNTIPTKFEITFILNEKRYRYGFEFNNIEVVSEWLFRKNIGREVDLFKRDKDVIEVSKGFGGSSKLIDASIEATRSNALFLSTCDMLNVKEAKDVFSWFKRLNVVDGLRTELEEFTTVNLWDEEEFKEKIKDYLNNLNLGFTDIEVEKKKFDIKDLPDDLDSETRNMLAEQLKDSTGYDVKTTHIIYDSEGVRTSNFINFGLDSQESEGTKRAFHLSGPILWALSNGGILVIDEIEAKTHPLMTINTIKLFLNRKSNPYNAQLIFATHDTNLLTYLNLRRDQIYFTEKNPFESTDLYSLSDMTYKDNFVKEFDNDKEKRYLEGRYGAIPVFSTFLDYLD